MTSNFAVAVDGAGFFFEIGGFQDGVLTELVLDSNHGVLQGFFLCLCLTCCFFPLDAFFHVAEEVKFDDAFRLRGLAVFIDESSHGNSDAPDEQGGAYDAVVEGKRFMEQFFCRRGMFFRLTVS